MAANPLFSGPGMMNVLGLAAQARDTRLEVKDKQKLTRLASKSLTQAKHDALAPLRKTLKDAEDDAHKKFLAATKAFHEWAIVEKCRIERELKEKCKPAQVLLVLNDATTHSGFCRRWRTERSKMLGLNTMSRYWQCALQLKGPRKNYVR